MAGRLFFMFRCRVYLGYERVHRLRSTLVFPKSVLLRWAWNSTREEAQKNMVLHTRTAACVW